MFVIIMYVRASFARRDSEPGAIFLFCLRCKSLSRCCRRLDRSRSSSFSLVSESGDDLLQYHFEKRKTTITIIGRKIGNIIDL